MFWKVAGPVPEPYSTRAALHLNSDLGAISADWRGWSIRRGELVSPEGLRLIPREPRALPLQLSALVIHRGETRVSCLDPQVARDTVLVREDLEAALAIMDAAIRAIRGALNIGSEGGDRNILRRQAR